MNLSFSLGSLGTFTADTRVDADRFQDKPVDIDDWLWELAIEEWLVQQ